MTGLPEPADHTGSAASTEPADFAEPADRVDVAPPVTGNGAVDAALRHLAEVGDRGPADQLPAYQAAHRTLRETLAGIDEEGRAD